MIQKLVSVEDKFGQHDLSIDKAARTGIKQLLHLNPWMSLLPNAGTKGPLFLAPGPSYTQQLTLGFVKQIMPLCASNGFTGEFCDFQIKKYLI